MARGAPTGMEDVGRQQWPRGRARNPDTRTAGKRQCPRPPAAPGDGHGRGGNRPPLQLGCLRDLQKHPIPEGEFGWCPWS